MSEKDDAARWRYFRDEMDEGEKLHMVANGTAHYDGIIDHHRLMHHEENTPHRDRYRRKALPGDLLCANCGKPPNAHSYLFSACPQEK